MHTKSVLPILIFLTVLAVVIVAVGVFYYTRPAVAPTVLGGSGVPTNQSTTASGGSSSSTATLPPTTFFSMNPAQGPVGTEVTIHGAGFAATNTVEMSGLVGSSMKNVASADGKTLQFTIPQNLGPNCNPHEACPQFLLLVMPKPYPITVVTNGTTRNIGTFTVTVE